MMKDLSRFWQSLEGVEALHAIPAFWELYCGPYFNLIRPHLRPTDMIGASYPCPYVGRNGHCPRRIVDLGDLADGQFEAICSDPYQLCPDVRLTSKDVVVQTLDIGSFTRMLADVLCIRWQPPEQRAGGAWGIGLSKRRKSLNQPVFLVIESSQPHFRSDVLELLTGVSGPFVLVAPTDQHQDVNLQEHLERRGITFVSLAEQVQLDENERLVAVDPFKGVDDLPALVVARSTDGKVGRTAGSTEAVAAVKAYLAAKAMTLTDFSIQAQMNERTVRRFLEKGEIQRASFKAMAEAMGLTAEELLTGELPDSIKRRTSR